MGTDRRSDILLAGLALVAIAHGALFGLAIYGLLALALTVLGESVPSDIPAIAFGVLAGLAFLAIALNRQRVLRDGRYRQWGSQRPPEPLLLERFQRLAAISSLERAPALCVMDNARPGAFAVGRSEKDASVVVTSALVELLDPAELDAVLAHQIATIESGAIKETSFADAVADSVGAIGRLRARLLWEPKKIFRETEEALSMAITLLLIVGVTESTSGPIGVVLTIVAVVLTVILAHTLITSIAGLVQLFLFLAFLGPLTAIEAVLAAPTIVLLSRLISRSRAYEADARSVEITGETAPLVSALLKLRPSELRRPDPGFESELRFALFAPPFLLENRPFPRLYMTHPSIPERIDAIESVDPKPARAAAGRP